MCLYCSCVCLYVYMSMISSLVNAGDERRGGSRNMALLSSFTPFFFVFLSLLAGNTAMTPAPDDRFDRPRSVPNDSIAVFVLVVQLGSKVTMRGAANYCAGVTRNEATLASCVVWPPDGSRHTSRCGRQLSPQPPTNELAMVRSLRLRTKHSLHDIQGGLVIPTVISTPLRKGGGW
ncbi:hypothetical protein F5X99DRAFT_204769 [Biscogniauxia marginata]|nr:hypothetical protein F5X99DRAFT_204769 [Biscogniauxia marginata]